MNEPRQKLAALILLIVAIVGGVVYYTWVRPNTTTPTPSAGATPVAIAIEGELVCLPHKAAEAQTLECAFGLRNDQGKYYGLQHVPHVASQTGVRVRITGSLETASANDTYDTIGTITVQGLTKL